ncbi:MAG: hypothetical protein EB101_05225 [Chitinophagia bacterium]|nr:hypothetical protein [Chitinophagia bacterium]
MPTYTPLQSIELTSTTTSVVFSGIPQIYQDLVLVSRAINTTLQSYRLQFNGDTGSNYSVTYLLGNGSSAISGRASNTVYIDHNYTDTTPAIGITHINNYSNSTTYKTALSRWSNAGSSDPYAAAYVGLWRNTAAINSITVYVGSSTMAAGTTFDLYGISPVAANNAQAAGGTDIFAVAVADLTLFQQWEAEAEEQVVFLRTLVSL